MKTPLRILAALAAATTFAAAQGSLTPPPGVPGPVMKTLDQVEARIAIPKSPAVPVAGPHYTISQPGSYYLTGNVEVASGNGINITSSNVTLDLNGFALISKTVTPPAGSAVEIAASLRSIEIKNGRITGGYVRTYTGPKPWNATFAGPGWLRGIQDVDVGPANGVLLSHLVVEKCASYGIDLDGSSVIVHVTALNNGGNGIFALSSALTNTSAIGNGDHGIIASGSVTNATVASNEGDGIVVYEGSVSNATAASNGSNGIHTTDSSVTNASATSNGSNGISADRGSVANANAASNGSNGISAFNGSVTNSRATGNFKIGIDVGVGVAAHCVASGNSTDPATVDKNINVSVGGQRDACVPASE